MDQKLVEKYAAHIVEAVARLRRHARPADLERDPVQYGFVVHELQTAVQAAIDVAAILVAERRLGEPATNRELFDLIARDGWVDPDRSDLWKRIVSFRNIVVHRYLTVDAQIVRGILENHLDDLLAFVRGIRDRLASSGN
ncbi:MAG: DUF86 domain-containing protein [Planctomycetes bacterium]|nr:DUF86 domain-containing protein [Planctomycetota bacterium]